MMQTNALEDRILQLESANEQLEIEARRFRWIEQNAKEEFMNPKSLSGEIPDLRTYWKMPFVICSGPVGGFLTLGQSIDCSLENEAED